MHTRKLVFSKVHGNPAERLAALRSPRIHAINPEGLRGCARSWAIASGRGTCCWWMKSTGVRGPEDCSVQSLRGLRHFKRRYVMTGTPTPRSLLQLWSQMFIADLGASLGQRYTDHKNNNFRKTGYMGCQAGAERRN